MEEKTKTVTVPCGMACGPFSLGGLVALVLSYKTHASILWALLHSCCSWFYVAYWAIVYWKWTP